MNKQQAIQALASELSLTGNSTAQYEALKSMINEWLLHDFNKLVQVLYRMDVSEKKLKALLANHPDTDAAALIADLMIERQLQKIVSREQHRNSDPGISDEERW